MIRCCRCCSRSAPATPGARHACRTAWCCAACAICATTAWAPPAVRFNIAAESLRLGDFTREQTLALLGQHTEATGQAFAPEALEAVWTQTRGQPWLVNALAHGTCFKNRALRDDRSRTVTADDIAAARDELIVNRVTHLDYLADKLREDRVRRVIEPMLSGADRYAFTDRDIAYVRDLGLVARDAPLRVANPIYAEVLPRELAWVAQETLDVSPPRYVRSDGSLDAELLMAEFQGFFRRHSEHWRNLVRLRGVLARSCCCRGTCSAW